MVVASPFKEFVRYQHTSKAILYANLQDTVQRIYFRQG